jgi:hypothetical protein
MRYEPGQRVRITQQIPRQTGSLLTTIEGTIVESVRQKSGSWYAHSPDHKLWLDRLEIRKDDGEIVFMNVDRNTHVELVIEVEESPQS